MKIAILTSSRADYGILYPLISKLKSDNFFKVDLIAFGSHLSNISGKTKELVLNDGFEIKYSLNTSPKSENGVANKAKRLTFKSGSTEDWLVGMGAASETSAFEIYNGNGQMALSFAKATSNASFEGSVGIGTTSPAGKLHVVGGTSGDLNAPAVLVQNNRFLTFQNAAGNAWGMGIYADSSNNGWIGAVNDLIFNTGSGATERARITSTGNMGLGTSSPQTKLEIAGNGNQTIRLSNTETSAQPNDVIGTLEYYSFDGDGAHIGAYVKGIQDSVDAYGRATALTFGTNAVNVAVAERMRISANGEFLIGNTTVTATPATGFCFNNPAGDSYVAIGHPNGSASGNYYAVFNYNSSVIGTISQNGTTAVLYNTTSDQRLKENIQDADSASSLIDALQVRQFDWKSDNSHQRYGFVAQELVTVAPEAVHQPTNEDEMMAVDYSKLVPMLVKEVQSLRKRLADAGI